ncbi:LOW QUALITY PROTEIN: voltage-gated potassium channel regulatory subunit KCNG3 [Heliangelus exortis]|uniref:LOW QUALITY PROTEIN: voltage-gated potassium channel regulatory subunit KCNG3 n=1 Tax=Heliangelus exortis TaxID=472823 RepID=UPI003A8EFEAC
MCAGGGGGVSPPAAAAPPPARLRSGTGGAERRRARSSAAPPCPRPRPGGAPLSRLPAGAETEPAASVEDAKPPLGRPSDASPAFHPSVRPSLPPRPPRLQAGVASSASGAGAGAASAGCSPRRRPALPSYPSLPALPLLRPAQAMNFGRGPSVVLNVGGTRYSFSREVLKDFPLRRVSRLHGCLSEQDVLEVCDDYDRERNEYFFDRHSEAFGFIMLYVRHGHLRFVPHMCELSFYNEMIYWGLEGSHLDYCCQRRLDDRMSETRTYYAAEEPPGETAGGPEGKGRRPPGAEGGKWLERMRRTFEEPTSSVAAQVLATVSILFVIVSMVVLCASTLPEWRAPENRSMEEQSRYTAESVREPSGIIEAICIGWFTAECIVRFIVSKNKCEFVRRPLNIIDLLAITPYYISVLMTVFTGENSQLQRAGVTLRVLRMMRIFWVIKLARHFIGLQTLGLTLKRCYREMVMLLVFICVAMAIFSALSQLLENGLDLGTKNKDYASIPAACWWVIISMTTVGYGDMCPITVPGRILGGICVVSGIVLLALPITFIYHSFVQCYHELKFRSARYSRSLSAEFLN